MAYKDCEVGYIRMRETYHMPLVVTDVWGEKGQRWQKWKIGDEYKRKKGPRTI